jgi:hypothetical protein
MTHLMPAGLAGLGRLTRALAIATAVLLTGCASFYVDGTTKEVPSAQFKKVVEPKPVQVLFEFQTKGVVNARATDHLKAQVVEQIKTSGLFASVDDKPVASGAVLNVTLNNVPLSDDAFSKGFVTGLTFGLAGSKVSDGYVCTMTYSDPKQGAPITKQARHAIHTTLGASSTPTNATKAENIEAAVRTMTRQIVSTALNDLSQDSAFK